MSSDSARTLQNDLKSMEERILDLETGDMRTFAADSDILNEARKIVVKKLRKQYQQKLKYHRLIEPKPSKNYDNSY